ncbi:MAG: hypothetical protein WCW26_01410 [Candidatus Buchananbacteria bacterium]
MDYLETKINQLVVERPGKSKSFVRTFSTKPTRDLAGKVGKIFGLIEIYSNDEQVAKLIDLIIEELKNNYYYQKSNFADDKFLSVSEKFELTLKKTNLAIAAFLESEQILLDLDKINIIIAVVFNQELHFAVVGNVGAILFYHTNLDTYRIINILDASVPNATSPDPFRLFAQIISGKIKPRDILFIGTANIFDYFSMDKIKNIITSNLLVEGLIELQKTLEQTPKENFGVITAELELLAFAEKRPIASNQEFDYQKAASRDSVKEMMKTEKETEKFLTPSLLPEVKKYFVAGKNLFGAYAGKTKAKAFNLYKTKKPNLVPGLNLKKPSLDFGPLVPKIKKINPLANVHINIDHKKITQPVLALGQKINSKFKHKPIWSKLGNITNRIFGNPINKYKKLPKSSQILLITTIILAVLFSLSIFWLAAKNIQDKKNEAFNLVFNQAEDKKNEAEASLIYRDENQARQFLVDAKNMILALKPTTKSQKQQVWLLEQGIEEQLAKLRHIIEVTEPIQIVNFQNLDSQAKISKLALLSGRNVYTQNQNNQSIYKANLSSRIMSAILTPDLDTAVLDLGASVSESELILLNSKNQAFKLDPKTDSLQKIKISFEANAAIADLTAFKGQIYTLDTKNNKINRYTKDKNEYTKVNSWIKDDTNLADSSSIAVDGSIYLLKKDGQIQKLENGKIITSFKTNVIDPKVQNPTKLKTDEFSKYLYFIDGPTKRIIVMDKEGKLINQYFSNSFDDLKDFVVIEKEKKIYILNGNSIFGVPTEHLK